MGNVQPEKAKILAQIEPFLSTVVTEELLKPIEEITKQHETLQEDHYKSLVSKSETVFKWFAGINSAASLFVMPILTGSAEWPYGTSDSCALVVVFLVAESIACNYFLKSIDSIELMYPSLSTVFPLSSTYEPGKEIFYRRRLVQNKWYFLTENERLLNLRADVIRKAQICLISLSTILFFGSLGTGILIKANAMTEKSKKENQTTKVILDNPPLEKLSDPAFKKRELDPTLGVMK
ncbi:MAG: hypothetical protein EOP07_10070 [Proteobacteria bacterium]|nr:MAG: hypothetical protein EOP07_10070 [Pseudomonadota bacterium]